MEYSIQVKGVDMRVNIIEHFASRKDPRLSRTKETSRVNGYHRAGDWWCYKWCGRLGSSESLSFGHEK